MTCGVVIFEVRYFAFDIHVAELRSCFDKPFNVFVERVTESAPGNLSPVCISALFIIISVIFLSCYERYSRRVIRRKSRVCEHSVFSESFSDVL